MKSTPKNDEHIKKILLSIVSRKKVSRDRATTKPNIGWNLSSRSEVNPLKRSTHLNFFLSMHTLIEFGLNNVMLVTQSNFQ